MVTITLDPVSLCPLLVVLYTLGQGKSCDASCTGHRVRGQGSELFYICQDMDKALNSEYAGAWVFACIALSVSEMCVCALESVYVGGDCWFECSSHKVECHSASGHWHWVVAITKRLFHMGSIVPCQTVKKYNKKYSSNCSLVAMVWLQIWMTSRRSTSPWWLYTDNPHNSGAFLTNPHRTCTIKQSSNFEVSTN